MLDEPLCKFLGNQYISTHIMSLRRYAYAHETRRETVAHRKTLAQVALALAEGSMVEDLPSSMVEDHPFPSDF